MTRWRLVWLSLGSNLGDSAGHLQAAVDFFSTAEHFAELKVSQVWRTAPVGGPAQPDYLNAVMQVSTDLPALEILAAAHACETLQDRRREERWGPRTLDVDIIAIAGEVHNSNELQVPHPRAHTRGFVLVPLAELVQPESVLGFDVTVDTSDMRRTDVVLCVSSDSALSSAEVNTP